MNMDNYSCLYILARSDLSSCNAGKMIAQSCHAQALFDNHNVTNDSMKSLIEEWKEVGSSYGTTIVLDVSKEHIHNIKTFLNIVDENVTFETEKYLTGIVSDPSYPFIIDNEYVELLDPNIQTLSPTLLNNDKSICYRKETTCMFIFGRKMDLTILLKQFNLY